LCAGYLALLALLVMVVGVLAFAVLLLPISGNLNELPFWGLVTLASIATLTPAVIRGRSRLRATVGARVRDGAGFLLLVWTPALFAESTLAMASILSVQLALLYWAVYGRMWWLTPGMTSLTLLGAGCFALAATECTDIRTVADASDVLAIIGTVAALTFVSVPMTALVIHRQRRA